MRGHVVGKLLILATLAACTASPPPTAVPTGQTGGARSPAPDSIADRFEAEIAVDGSPDLPTAAFGSMWVLSPDLPLGGKGSPVLVRIDPSTNAVVATIALEDRLCQGFVATDDAIWVCAGDALVRVDPETNSVTQRVPISGTQGTYRLASGAGRVWALGNGAFAADTVIALDPRTGMTASYPVGGRAGGLTFAYDALWVTIPAAGSVVRLDPATGAVRTLVTGRRSPGEIVAGDGDLWVSLHGGPVELYPSEGGSSVGVGEPQLERIDARSGSILAEVAIGEAPRGGLSIWPDGSTLLVRGPRPWLARVDGATSKVVETFEAGSEVEAMPGPLTVAFGSIWTVNLEQPVVYRVKP